MQVTMTIQGLYLYDPTLFDGFALPSEINKEILIDNLLSELFELEVIYPDVNIMKSMISRWSATMTDEWGKLYKALDTDYDATGQTSINKEERNLTALNSSHSQGKSENKVAGFNSGSLVNSAADNTSGDSNSTLTDRGTITRTRTLSGYLGGMSSARLIAEEIKLRNEYDIYSIIINDFKQKFCLLIY